MARDLIYAKWVPIFLWATTNPSQEKTCLLVKTLEIAEHIVNDSLARQRANNEPGRERKYQESTYAYQLGGRLEDRRMYWLACEIRRRKKLKMPMVLFGLPAPDEDETIPSRFTAEPSNPSEPEARTSSGSFTRAILDLSSHDYLPETPFPSSASALTGMRG